MTETSSDGTGIGHPWLDARNQANRTVCAIALAGALAAATPATAEWAQWGDPLYRKVGVEEAAAAIAWGNEAKGFAPTEAIRIDPPLGGVDRTDDKVTVFELYEYGAFSDGGGRKDWKVRADEVMMRWKASLPEHVEVIRIPIVNQYRRGKAEEERVARRREIELRLVMTAQVTGVADEIDRELVDAFDRDPDTRVTRERAREWITAAGIGTGDFERAWNSERVTRMVERGKDQHWVGYRLSRKHGKRRFRHEPPILLVDNKTVVARNNAGGSERAFRIANALISAELANDDEPTAEDLRWRALLDGMVESRQRDVAWGQERVPREGEVFVLDPALETADDGRIEIEWFYTYVSRGWYAPGEYSTWLSLRTAVTMRDWLGAVPESVRKQIQPRFSPVGSIPGEAAELAQHHRIHQRMVLGAGYDEDWGASRKADAGLRRVLGMYSDGLSMDSKRSRQRAMRAGEVSWRAFQKAWKSGIGEERADRIDARFAEVNRQLAERAPQWLEAPRHPIIVVDGRYLIQGSTSGGMVPVIRLFNRVLRREHMASDR